MEIRGKLMLELRTVYGRDLIYPLNETARQFTKLVDRKVLRLEDLEIIKALGFEIELVTIRSLEDLRKTKES